MPRGAAPSVSIAHPTQSEPEVAAVPDAPDDLLARQALFGYSHEDVELVLAAHRQEGYEPVWSMGDDTRSPCSRSSPARSPPTSSSGLPRSPIPHRLAARAVVMSLTTYLGPRGDLLSAAEPTATLLQLDSPLLDEGTFGRLLATARERYMPVVRLATAYRLADDAPATRTAALEPQCVERWIADGACRRRRGCQGRYTRPQ